MNATGRCARVLACLLVVLGCAAAGGAEVLVRWDLERVPSAASLGVETLGVPAAQVRVVTDALAQGYRVFVEIDAADLAGPDPSLPPVAGLIVRGTPPDALRQALTRRFGGLRVLVAEERARWPHLRSRRVTLTDGVLQVSGRSAQPWMETNAALVQLRQSESDRPLLTYPWTPRTDGAAEPQLDDYLLAIAEAGSLGADLLLPLHERFQRDLLSGRPEALAWWDEIRRHIEFYSREPTAGHQPLANVGIVADDPAPWFEVMNLMARHNLPFRHIAPSQLAVATLRPYDLLIVLEQPDGSRMELLAAYAASGGTVILAAPGDPQSDPPWRSRPGLKGEGRTTYTAGAGRVVEMPGGPGDPNRLALEVRQLLGRDGRVLDVWNGITVLAAPFVAPPSGTMLVTVVNYAPRTLPVQLRVRGAFQAVRFEAPGQPPRLLPFHHRDGGTEVVLPALRAGGRIVLTGQAAQPTRR